MNEEVDPDFLTFLREEEERAFDGTLLADVEAALNSYNGRPYGDEEDGRSQVVAADVSEAADYMLTSLMDVMAGSSHVVEFEPPSREDQQVVDDATAAMHFLYRKKSGYRLMHDWMKAGLLEKIGVVKTCVERKKKRVEREIPSMLLPGETEEELRAHGIIQAEPSDPQDFDGIPIDMHRVVTIEEGTAEFRDYFVPLEEFRFSADARDFDTAPYLAHIPSKSVSELVEMGFDADQFDNIRDDGAPSTVSFARDDGRTTFIADDRRGANRKLWLKEEYPLYDLDGDGIAERLCVHRVGNTILLRDGKLAIEPTDYQPFEHWCPFPMQGRLVGQSQADKTMDGQRVSTVVERLMLDSGYQQLQPGTFIHEDSCGDHTIDDLLTVHPGRIVRFTGQTPPIPEARPDISGTALQILQYKAAQRESRTGITQLNRGVDDDTLNDTAKGQAQLMSRGQQMERYIIRNAGEGVGRLFMKKVGLMRKHGRPFQIRVDGEYREVDPSQWPEDMEVNVKVGLGSGSKEDRIMGRQMVAQMQAMAVQGGLQIASPDNIYNNMTGLARDFGLQPNDLWTEPQKDEQGNPVPQEPQPDPEMIKAQIESQKAEHKAGLDQMQAQHKAQLAEQEQARKAAEAMGAAQLKEFEVVSKLRADAMQKEFEARLAVQELHFEQRLAAQKQKDDAAAKKFRDGGRLDK